MSARRLLTLLREGVLNTADGTKVYYQDDQTLRDALDLYAVTREQHDTGSPNLENDQAREIVHSLQRGGGLSEVQIGKLRQLLAKYAAEIKQLRASPDRHGQDFLDVPDHATARIIQKGSQFP